MQIAVEEAQPNWYAFELTCSVEEKGFLMTL